VECGGKLPQRTVGIVGPLSELLYGHLLSPPPKAVRPLGEDLDPGVLLFDWHCAVLLRKDRHLPVNERPPLFVQAHGRLEDPEAAASVEKPVAVVEPLQLVTPLLKSLPSVLHHLADSLCVACYSTQFYWPNAVAPTVSHPFPGLLGRADGYVGFLVAKRSEDIDPGTSSPSPGDLCPKRQSRLLRQRPLFAPGTEESEMSEKMNVKFRDLFGDGLYYIWSKSAQRPCMMRVRTEIPDAILAFRSQSEAERYVEEMGQPDPWEKLLLKSERILAKVVCKEKIVVQVTCGVHSNSFDVIGQTVGYVRANLGVLFGIPENAAAFVNGEKVGDGHVLDAGVELDFLRLVGSKGVGKVWFDPDMCDLFEATIEDLDDLEVKGCRCVRFGDGRRRWTETALDEFIRGGSVECNEQVLKVLARIEKKLDQRLLTTAPEEDTSWRCSMPETGTDSEPPRGSDHRGGRTNPGLQQRHDSKAQGKRGACVAKRCTTE